MTSYFSDRENGAPARVQDDISTTVWGGLYVLVSRRLADHSFGFRDPDQCADGYPLVPYFVGCEMKVPPPPGAAKGVHFVDLRIVTIGGMKLIGSVRLFAHSGTSQHGMPIYRVVVGAPAGERK